MTLEPRDWKSKGQYFGYKDHKIFYVTEGSGDPILLLHGFPTSSWDWTKIWNQLAENYKLIALDFLGFGFSDKPSSHNYRFSEQCDIVEDLCESLEISSVHILAHDYGDTVLQELLMREVENNLKFEIKSAFLLNGGIFPQLIQFRFIQRLLMSRMGWLVSKFINKNRFEKSFSSIFAFDKIPSKEELDAFWHIVSYNDGHRLGHKLIKYIDERFDYQERWVNAFLDTNVPLHFLVGTEDPVSGKRMGDYFEEFVGEEFVTFLNEIGHYPHWEDSKAVLDNYFNFLNSIE